METNVLASLQDWYVQHCNGDWEHQHGVEIGTLDNPGWRLVVDLQGTEAEGKELDRQVVEKTDQDWVQYWSDGQRFEAACGPLNLVEALTAFQDFTRSSRSE